MKKSMLMRRYVFNDVSINKNGANVVGRWFTGLSPTFVINTVNMMVQKGLHTRLAVADQAET